MLQNHVCVIKQELENFIAIASVFSPVSVTNNQMKISDNFQLMRITGTQMIAHYSVNFDLIQKSFKRLSL